MSALAIRTTAFTFDVEPYTLEPSLSS